MLEIYTAAVLDRCLVAWCALGRGMTLNEFENAQNYRYLYSVEAVRKNFEETNHQNTHKEVSLMYSLYAPILFFFSCKKEPLYRQSPHSQSANYGLLSKDSMRQRTSSGDDQSQPTSDLSLANIQDSETS